MSGDRVADFDYELPDGAIAQTPADRRDRSRLLVARGGPEADPPPELEHRRFADLPELLQPGDVLVVNDARVLPARLYVRRQTGGRVELLFLGPAADGGWRALARPARRVREGDRLTVEAEPGIELVVEAVGDGGERTVRPVASEVEIEIVELLERWGRMPLPPYIRRESDESGNGGELERLDRERYQTVYAATPGAVAAPTAGLHFTEPLLDALRARGVEVETVTLHVGAGTFRPVTAERVDEHAMDTEAYRIVPEVAARLNEAKAAGRRLIAVGTTSVRSLEHARGPEGMIRDGERGADLYITPGYRFRVVDGMITNFHLPRSTPILLVAAMLGRERLLAAYREAIERGYRFYSYGDAMLVLP